MNHLDHQGQPLLRAGAPLEEAAGVMIMVHGRGASAADILTLSEELQRPDFAYLAPQAAGYTWYPNSFLAPLQQNEPALSSALAVLAGTLEQVGAADVPPEKVILLGFSQGGCLALEFAARNAQRYGSLVGLSAGLIGPPGTPRDYPGSLGGTPTFLGCSDVDPHIPLQRVEESARALAALDAAVSTRIYPGFGHAVNGDEIDAVRAMMTELAPA